MAYGLSNGHVTDDFMMIACMFTIAFWQLFY